AEPMAAAPRAVVPRVDTRHLVGSEQPPRPRLRPPDRSRLHGRPRPKESRGTGGRVDRDAFAAPAPDRAPGGGRAYDGDPPAAERRRASRGAGVGADVAAAER